MVRKTKMPKVLRSPAAISEEQAMQQVMQALGGSAPQSPPVEPAKVESPPPRPADSTAVLVAVELAAVPPSEFTVHVDMKLTPPQSTTARRIAAHLDRRQATLRNGQRVLTPSGAIKWLLEQIEKEMQAS